MRRIRKCIAMFAIVATLVVNVIPVSAAEAVAPQTGAPAVDYVHLINYYIEKLDIPAYMRKNPDLVQVFGSNVPMYVLHYALCGVAEGRRTGTWDPVAFVVNNREVIWQSAISGRTDYFNIEQYKKIYPSVVKVLGDDTIALITHYLSNGIYEGKLSGGKFDPRVFANQYPNADLRTNSTVEQLAAAFLVEKVKAYPTTSSASSSSASTSSSSSGGSSSGGSSSGGGNENPSKPSNPNDDNESIVIDNYKLRRVNSDGEHFSEDMQAKAKLSNPEGLGFVALWNEFYEDIDVYVDACVGENIVYAFELEAEDFSFNDEEYEAVLVYDDFFTFDFEKVEDILETLTITYEPVEEGGEDEPSNPDNGDENPNDPEDGNDELVFDDMSSNIRSAQFKLRNGDVVELPETVSDLIERGYYFTTGDLGTEVGAGETAEVGMYANNENINNSHKVLLTVKNFSDEEVTVEECIAYKAYWANTSTDSIMVLPGGITLESTYDDIRTIAGQADEGATYNFDTHSTYYLTDEDSSDDAVYFAFNAHANQVVEELTIKHLYISTLAEAEETYSDSITEPDEEGSLDYSDMSSSIRSGQFKLRNDDIVTMPEYVSDLVDRGYYLTSADLSSDVQAGSTVTVSLYADSNNIDNTHKVLLTVKNFSDEVKTVTECIAYEMLTTVESDIVLPSGITLGSLYTDVKSSQGEPDWGTYYYIGNYETLTNAVKFSVDSADAIEEICITVPKTAEDLYNNGDSSDSETPGEEGDQTTDDILELELDDSEELPDVCERPENITYDDLVTPVIGGITFRGEAITDINEEGVEEHLRYECITLQDLLNTGELTLVENQTLVGTDEDGNSVDIDLTADTEIGSYTGTTGTYCNIGDVTVQIGLVNPTSETCVLRDCYVWRIYLDSFDKESGLTFSLLSDNEDVENITYDSTMMDIRGILGTPAAKSNYTSSYSRTWKFEHLWHGVADTVSNDSAALDPYMELKCTFDSEYKLDSVDMTIPVPAEVIEGSVEVKDSLDDYTEAEYSNITVGGLPLTVPTSVEDIVASGFVAYEYEGLEALTSDTEVTDSTNIGGYFIKKSEVDSSEPTILVFVESYENMSGGAMPIDKLGIQKISVSPYGEITDSVSNTVYYCDSYLGMCNEAVGGTIESPVSVDVLKSMYGEPSSELSDMEGAVSYVYEIEGTDYTVTFDVLTDSNIVMSIAIASSTSYEVEEEEVEDNYLLSFEEASTFTVNGNEYNIPSLTSEFSALEVNPVSGYTALSESTVESGDSAMCLYNYNDIFSIRLETEVNRGTESMSATDLNVNKVVFKYLTISEIPEDASAQALQLAYNGLTLCMTKEDVEAVIGTTTDIRNGVYAYAITTNDGVSTAVVEVAYVESDGVEYLTSISIEVQANEDVPTTGAL